MDDNGLELRFSTGHPRIDTMLRGAVGIFEAAFPGRIRGYYLFGSHADGSAVAASDLDIFVVFIDDFLDQEEEERARNLRYACSRLSPVTCDLLSYSERSLLTDGHFRLKAASLFLYGEDMRDRMPAISLNIYLRIYSQAPLAYAGQVFRHKESIIYPLEYPNPSGPFYGYDCHDARIGQDGGRSIKGMVSAVCWAATMIVAFQSGQMIGTKAESVRAYRASVGDQWAGFIEAVYANGKTVWGYRVPDDPAGQTLLRDLCRETLAFENHYLALYRAYLLGQLHEADETSIRFAIERLGTVHYPDAEVAEALRAVAASGPATVRDAARETLGRIEDAWKGEAR